MKKLLTFIIFLAVVSTGWASHNSTEIHSMTHQYVGPSDSSGYVKYRIIIGLTVYSDQHYKYCGSNPLATKLTSQNKTTGKIDTIRSLKPISYSELSGISSAGNAKEVSTVCYRGTYQAQVIYYEAITYHIRGFDYDVRYADCFASSSILNNFRNSNIFQRQGITTIVNAGVFENNGPMFLGTNHRDPIFKVGEATEYSFQAGEKDGDSLVYDPVCPLLINGSLQPQNGATCSNQIRGFNFDGNTGKLSGTSSVQGGYAFAFYVKEYDRCTKQLKGISYRSSIVSIANTKKAPIDTSGILNHSSNLRKKSNFEFEVCAGDKVTWNTQVWNLRGSKDPFVSSNILTNFDGVKVKTTPMSSPRVNVQYTWDVQAQPGVYYFTEYYHHDTCASASAAKIFKVTVRPGMVVNANQTICKADTATIESTQGKNVKWQSLNGDSIKIGVNWFIDSSSSVNRFWFVPSKTTTILAFADSVNLPCGGTEEACVKTDTIIIKVADSFSLQLSKPIVTCDSLYDFVEVTPSNANFTYSYLWSSVSGLENPNVAKTRVVKTGISQDYLVTVTSDSGCTREGKTNAIIRVLSSGLSISGTHNYVCRADTVNLQLNNYPTIYPNVTLKWTGLSAGKPDGIYGAKDTTKLNIASTQLTDNSFGAILTDTLVGCTDTLFYNFKVLSKYPAKPILKPVYCIEDGFVSLPAPTPQGLNGTYNNWTGRYISHSTFGRFDLTAAGAGKHLVTFEIAGDSCTNSDTAYVHVVTPEKIQIGALPFVCQFYENHPQHELKGFNSNFTFNGYGIDSTIGNPNKYWLRGIDFNSSTGTVDTAVVNYRANNGCAIDTTFNVEIHAPWDSTYAGIKSNGSVYYTDVFCINNRLDTLVANGPNAKWTLLNSPLPIIDSLTGAIDITKLQVGSYDVKVEGTELCKTSNTFKIHVIEAPQIEIITETYCNGLCNDTSIAKKEATFRFRIPKGPGIGGTGNTNLNSTGFDPTNEIITGDVSTPSSGWRIPTQSGRFVFWSGPTNFFPNREKGAFLPCDHQEGTYSLAYNYGISYRANQPDSVCARRALFKVDIIDNISLNLPASGDLCGKDSLLFDADIQDSSIQYSWSNGVKTPQLLVKAKGNYTVKAFNDHCSDEAIVRVIHSCSSIGEQIQGIGVNVYPNPVRSKLNIVFDLNNEGATGVLYNSSGQELKYIELEQNNSIDVTELPAGLYQLQIIKNNQSVHYKLIID